MTGKVFHHLFAPHIAVVVSVLIVLVGLIGWSVSDAVLHIARVPAHNSAAFAAAHVAAMRAEMEQIHRGHVDEATLGRSSAEPAAAPPMDHGSFLEASYKAADGDAIARYLTSEPAAPPPAPVHTVRAVQVA